MLMGAATDLLIIFLALEILSIPLYVKRVGNGADDGNDRSLPELWAEWEQNGRVFWQEMDTLVEMLDGVLVGEVSDD